MSGTFVSLLIVESILTGAAILMFVYARVLDMKEEDRLILDDAEAHLAKDQASIRRKATLLNRYMKLIGVAWSLLAVVIAGMWVVQGLSLL
jgi:hypothetical protein